MYSQILYSAFEVQECLSRGEAVMIDVRDPDAFQQAHIPGAVNVPEVFSYLATSTPEGLAEMHAIFEGLFARAGIASSKKVFFYEGNLHELYGGSCRGYWLLRYFGHSAAAILDGGLAAWQAKGFPLEKGAADCTPAAFAVQPLPEMIATKADVLDALQSSDVILLDDRDEVEWAGLSSSPYGIDFAPRKGRIPGARWIEWYRFMHVSRPQPCFKSPDEIKGLCAEKSIFPEDDIIVYCFKGSRAANTFVALQQAGFDKVRVYFASWNEWSRCSELPIDDRMLAE